MNTNSEITKKLTAACGFEVTLENGRAWPNTGASGRCLSSAARSSRLATLARVAGSSVRHGLYVMVAKQEAAK